MDCGGESGVEVWGGGGSLSQCISLFQMEASARSHVAVGHLPLGHSCFNQFKYKALKQNNCRHDLETQQRHKFTRSSELNIPELDKILLESTAAPRSYIHTATAGW